MIYLKSSSIESFNFNSADLQLRCVSPGAEIHRLYRFPGGDFQPAPPQYRTGRLDPPAGRSSEYGVLYAADTLITAALECGELLIMPTDPPTYERSFYAGEELPPTQHAVLRVLHPVKFLDFTDGATTQALGLSLNSILDNIPVWRNASARAVEIMRQKAFGEDIAGICYHSKRRPAAVNYALVQGRYEHLFVVERKGLAILD